MGKLGTKLALFLAVAGILCGCAAKTPDVYTLDRSGLFPVVNVDAEIDEAEGLQWIDAQNLLVEGRGWEDTENFWERLPARANGLVTEPVWRLSKNTAGICVRFVTDAQRVDARWPGGGAMNHMAATGVSGLDLYRRTGNGWTYHATGRPREDGESTAKLVKNSGGELTEYLLYLPLYHGVEYLKLGIDKDATIYLPPMRAPHRVRPIVFYGTSITQGGCASRTGMCHPAMIGRWLDREVINLGFSGSGRMEPEMADLLGELDAELYILECLPNMTIEMVGERIEPFVKRLRGHRPDTPILLVESPFVEAENVVLREVYRQLLRSGETRIELQPGNVLLAGDEEGTVDGVHPTDLGFYWYAKAIEPRVRAMIGEPASGI